MNHIQFSRQIILLQKIIFVLIFESIKKSTELNLQLFEDIKNHDEKINLDIYKKINKKTIEKYTNIDFMFTKNEKIIYEFLKVVLNWWKKRNFSDSFTFVDIIINDSITFWMNSYFWNSLLSLFIWNKIIWRLKKSNNLFYTTNIISATEQDKEFIFENRPIYQFIERTKKLFNLYFFEQEEFFQEKKFQFDFVNHFISIFLDLYKNDKEKFIILMNQFWYVMCVFLYLFIKYIIFTSWKLDKKFINSTDNNVWKFEEILKTYFWNDFKNIEESIKKLNLY